MHRETKSLGVVEKEQVSCVSQDQVSKLPGRNGKKLREGKDVIVSPAIASDRVEKGEKTKN